MAAISAIFLAGSLATSYACAHALMSLLFIRLATGRTALHSQRQLSREIIENRLGSITPVARAIEKTRNKRRAEDFEREMPEVLRLLCIALESGSSLAMALHYAAYNCDEPLSSELKRTVWDLEAGQGFDEALEKLRSRTGGTEFSYLAVAMEIQHQSGGSLTDILMSVSALLQQASELKEELRTKTAQGRLSSRIVAIMPFALLAILSLFTPDYLSSFFASPFGACLFVLALLLEAAGIVLVRRALAIDFTVDLDEGV